MNELQQWIVKHIEEKGPITFREFMDLALYHPQHGYYTGTRNPFGKTGDFYTAPGVHPVFGEVLGAKIREWWLALEKPNPFILVEMGAGRGDLAKAILNSADNAPFLQGQIRYVIIEASPVLRERQREALEGFAVTWLDNLSELGQFQGCIVSNELVDAFPVHIVEQTQQGLREIYVTSNGAELVETMGPLSSEELETFWSQLGRVLPVGYRSEINLDALSWLSACAAHLERGFVLTIDYGDEAQYLYDESRPTGTIRAYRTHQITSRVLEAPGEQDLTADVNFTALEKWGEQQGLTNAFFGTQAQFLVESGILQRLENTTNLDPFLDETHRRNMAIKHLILPGGMGERFKVLVQQKRPD